MLLRDIDKLFLFAISNLIEKVSDMSIELDRLNASAEEAAAAVTAVVTKVATLAAEVEALKASQVDPAALNAVADKLDAIAAAARAA
jgi:phage host-nuclease inhibitor protein Gam